MQNLQVQSFLLTSSNHVLSLVQDMNLKERETCLQNSTLCLNSDSQKLSDNSNKENMFEYEAQEEKSAVIKINNLDIRCFA